MPEYVVELPTPHAGQLAALDKRTRFYAIRCGRRWGKTNLAVTIASDAAIRQQRVGWFVPDYKRMSEPFIDLRYILRPIIARSSSTQKEIRTITGGGIDFWTLDDPNAGRGRFYHLVIIDEAAFTDDATMMDTWDKAIKPTLLDYHGSAVVLSNTCGNDPQNFFWRICNQPEHGFTEFHAPSTANPVLPIRWPGESDEDYAVRRTASFEELRKQYPPRVYDQEFEALFVDWSGDAFFSLSNLLGPDGEGVDYPTRCDSVYVTIDTATKTGKENDGTAAVYFAKTREAVSPTPLIVLDYDIAQIEGATLEQWLPSVFDKAERLAVQCQARGGMIGVWIEDKASGMILLQQARKQNRKVFAIDSKLTAVGKVERAINASGPVVRGKVKLSDHANDKVVPYKGTSRNHLRSQVLGFRPGSKDQVDDDILDCFTYGVALSFDNAQAMAKTA